MLQKHSAVHIDVNGHIMYKVPQISASKKTETTIYRSHLKFSENTAAACIIVRNARVGLSHS